METHILNPDLAAAYARQYRHAAVGEELATYVASVQEALGSMGLQVCLFWPLPADSLMVQLPVWAGSLALCAWHGQGADCGLQTWVAPQARLDQLAPSIGL